MSASKEFIKLVRENSHGHSPWQVFTDFCELGALAIANRMEVNSEAFAAREKRYEEITRTYKEVETVRFGQMLGAVSLALEDEYQDFLGKVFHELELANHFKGQFFTPYHLCKVIAGLQLQDAAAIIEEQGFIVVAEPACGAGAMIIAAAEALREQGINFQETLYVEGIDVDKTAVNMAYIQWSLLGVPARVVHGNSLSMEMWSETYTPFYWMGTMPWKVRRWREEALPENVTPIKKEDRTERKANITVSSNPDDYEQLTIHF